MVADGNAPPVRPDDLHYDCQSQAGSVGSDAPPTPEPVKDARPVIDWYAWPTVQNTERPVLADVDDHLRPGCRVCERVFDEIT